MTYSPHHVCIYNKAITGCQAGLAASRAYPLDPNEADYVDPAERADAYAQAVDAAWGSAAFTNADLDQIYGMSQAIWANGRSPVIANGKSASGYTSLAIAIVAATQAGTAQIVSQGIDPNGCAGGEGGGCCLTPVFVSAGDPPYQILSGQQVWCINPSPNTNWALKAPLVASAPQDAKFEVVDGTPGGGLSATQTIRVSHTDSSMEDPGNQPQDFTDPVILNMPGETASWQLARTGPFWKVM